MFIQSSNPLLTYTSIYIYIQGKTTLHGIVQSASPSLGQEALKRLLFDDDITHRAQPLPPGLLLFEQLASPGDVASVQLSEHILAERLQGLSGDDASTSGCLNDDLCKDGGLAAASIRNHKKKKKKKAI